MGIQSSFSADAQDLIIGCNVSSERPWKDRKSPLPPLEGAVSGPVTARLIGAVTKGHQVYQNEIWFHKFGEWLQDFVGSNVTVHEVNGAAPGESPFCHPDPHQPSSDRLRLFFHVFSASHPRGFRPGRGRAGGQRRRDPGTR